MDDRCCSPAHPLSRDGTSQDRRAARMLDPKGTALDDRGLRHMLAWATDYARELVFYNSTGKISGDWIQLVKNDPSTLIALISLYDHRALLAAYRTAEAKVAAADTEAAMETAFLQICQKVISLAALFDGWYGAAHPDLLVYRELKTAIRADLAPAVQRLKAYDKVAKDTLSRPGNPPLGLDYSALEDRRDLWLLDSPLEESVQHIFAGDTFAEQIAAATPKVTALFTGMQQILVRTVAQAPRMLENSLKWPYHEPHMALFIAFLKLFEMAQDALNDFTEKHLLHYYERVLKLGRKASEPDKAHLVFTLSGTQKETFLLEKGARFKAGKDSAGQDLTYELSRSVALNRASVEDIRAFYWQETGGQTSLHVSPDAKSADGAGKPFEDPEKAQWLAFGQDTGRSAPTLGLVIASPILNLAEGTRTITVTLGFSAATQLPSAADLAALLTAEISTAAAWMPVPQITIGLADDTEEAINEQLLELVLTIPAGTDPVTAFEEGSDLALFDTRDPVLKLVPGADALSKHFAFLSTAAITSLSIDVAVSGLETLVLETTLGPVPVGKPFPAFGTAPKNGASLLVGSWEAMQKALTQFSITLTWDEEPKLDEHYQGYGDKAVGNNDFDCDLLLLDKKRTGGDLDLDIQEPDSKLFRAKTVTIGKSAISGWSRDPDTPPFVAFSPALSRGFARLVLNGDLRHDAFLPIYTAAALQLAGGKAVLADPEKENQNTTTLPEIVLPKTPFVPTLQSVSMAYRARDDWPLGTLEAQEDIGRLFHLHPYGHSPVASGKATLVADMGYGTIGASTSGTGAAKQRGALYIGLATPPTSETGFTLSLLLQVAEGTENPTLDAMPTVSWSYLAGDSWTALEDEVSVGDGTSGLIQSGLVTLKVGPDITTHHTLMPSGLFWIRATVNRDPDGICDLIDIRAQAGEAIFADRDNTANHLATALPAGTIAKMINKDTRLSAIEQPYASFGGKPQEQDTAFFTRVSERLRHKDRAITIWDYERLVLEAFPSVYKAKCISHATRVQDGAAMVDREIAPGQVMMVIVPNVRDKSGFDRIKPYTSQAARDDMKAFLEARAPHQLVGRIKVVNPTYEEIKTRFQVTYNQAIPEESLATEQLRRDLVEYLSPWAFAGGRDIAFGGKVHASAIIDFIDERPYVVAVHHFEMEQSVGGGFQKVLVAEPRSARSILVSAPEQDHDITGTMAQGAAV